MRELNATIDMNTDTNTDTSKDNVQVPLHSETSKDPAEEAARSKATLDLLLDVASVLFVNGQTSQKTVQDTEKLARVFGLEASVFPSWGELTLRVDKGAVSRQETISAIPSGIDMLRVSATMNMIDSLDQSRSDTVEVRAALDDIERLPHVSTLRFALMAAAGAVALGIIFGETHPWSLVWIAASACSGGYLRRWISSTSRNLFVQPFAAALLAGIVGAIATRFRIDSTLNLISICPCMVLVPGPHLLNGAVDLARGRLPLGISRIVYAGLIILMICAGLLLGLSIGGVSLPITGPSTSVPIAYDAIAAGVAVAAYGTFFAMPWRTLPIPILIGVLAHACRWSLMTLAGENIIVGAFVACLVVGAITTRVSDRLRLPFAALAFASVVSLIPGVYLFRMAAGMVALVTHGATSPPNLLLETVTNGVVALLVILAMTFGLLLPKILGEYIADRRKRSAL